MNENIDLTKILEGCPDGTKLYSPILGDVEFKYIHEDAVLVHYNKEFNHAFFDKEGKFYDLPNTECTLFPSKDQRDWSKFERFWDKPKVKRFDIETFQPFDKILFRLQEKDSWRCGLFSHIVTDYFGYKTICTSDGLCVFCVPYNDDTKHLIGTTDNCPEFYKWWEE